VSGIACYRLFGLAIESPVPLSSRAMSSRTRPDVRLCEASRLCFNTAHRILERSSKPLPWFECHRLPDETTYLRWAGLFEFLIAPDGRTIEYRRLAKATHESLTTYLLGQILSFSLLSFGYEPLHATAVVIDGAAVAFLGDCGYGKSTLGAAFVSRGFPMLTDDVLALKTRDRRWIAHAGPARLKLFPSVARRVLGRSSASTLNPDTAKLIVPLAAGEATRRVVPLRALFVLPDPAAQHTSARVRIVPLHGEEAFLEVTRAAFNLIQVDRARLERHFAMATALVRDVPLRRLAYPRVLASLDEVCDAIVNDIRSQRTPPAVPRKERRTLPARAPSRSRPRHHTRPTRARRAT